jgi:hypothetical protein
VKYHVFVTIGTGHGNEDMAMTPPEWVDFCNRLEGVATEHKTRVWFRPTYARRDQLDRYAGEGYQGCIGRTLDRISVFPDCRAYSARLERHAQHRIPTLSRAYASDAYRPDKPSIVARLCVGSSHAGCANSSNRTSRN